MFKISFFVRKKDGVPGDAFRHYWLGEHAHEQMGYLSRIGVRQYLKCEVLAGHPLTIDGVRSYQRGRCDTTLSITGYSTTSKI